MNFLRQPIERKLSALLGMPVMMDKLDVAVFKGAAIARGVTIGDDPAEPLLRVDGIRFDIAMGRALQKEIQVKSLTVDKPVVTLVRRADGTWNLPKVPPRPAAAAATADEPGVGGDEVGSNWKFDLSKLLLVDGAVHLRIALDAATTYELGATNVIGEISRHASELRFTLMTEALRCADRPAPVGELKLAGKLWPFGDFGKVDECAMQASLELGNNVRLTITTDRLAGRAFTLLLDAALDVAELIAFLPTIPALAPLRVMGLRGPVRLSTDVQFTAPEATRPTHG